MVVKKEKLLNVNVTLIFNLMFQWQISYKEITNLLQFAINIIKSHSQPKCTFCNSCVKIGCCSSELIFTFLYAGSSIQNASQQFVSRIHFYFINFILHPTSKTKIQRIPTTDSNISPPLNIHNCTHVHNTFLLPQWSRLSHLKYSHFLLNHPICIHSTINNQETHELGWNYGSSTSGLLWGSVVPNITNTDVQYEVSISQGKGLNTVRSESRCALRLRCVAFVVRIEVSVEVCCCFIVFSC
jgi:hypothetical protein